MLFRKLIRTIGKYKAQFLSMIIMIALGVGVFAGFSIEWYSLEKDGTQFFEDTNYADYHAILETGFSEDDAEAVRKIEGVDQAERCLNINTSVKGEKKTLSLYVAEHPGISDFLVTGQKKGVEYTTDAAGIWLSDSYAKENKISLGDKVTVVYQGTEMTEEVVGLIKSPEFTVCLADSNQIMPDYKSHGYFYISPGELEKKLGMTFYPQINIRSDLSKKEMEKAVNKALGKTTYLLGQDEMVSRASMQSEVEEGQTMAAILPVLFLLIAILTMVTTMHRITINEKTQIGTLKALGFRDKRILWHYTSFGLVIGVLGTVLGIGLGIGVAAYLLNTESPLGQYFDIPEWKLYMPWYGRAVLVGLILFLTLISYLSVKRMLKGNAADVLRPYIPSKMKPTVLERGRLWEKLSFGTRWNLRDIFRHKARSFMTLFGIVGCMILLVGGVGMKDTMDAFMDTYYDKVSNYKTKINFADTTPNEEAEKLAEEYDGDWVAAASVQLDGETVSFEVYNTKHGNYRFVDEDGEIIELSDDGAYVCSRLEEKAPLNKKMTFSPYGSDNQYTVTTKGYIRSVMTENIAMTKECADKLNVPYHITSMYTQTESGDIANSKWIAGKSTKQSLVESLDSFIQMLYMSVIVLALFAVVLSVVVLYNLGVMSYMERYRELATLKVVGFRDRHIGKILISQNVWITILGILIGLPAGYGVLSYLLTALASEYEMRAVCGSLTWSVSIVLTLGVSLLVSWCVARKNRKIDMVEALKGIE